MATVPQTPRKTDPQSGEMQRTSEQLRRDRINLGIVIAVFAALVAVMIWLATLSPPSGEMTFPYPPMP
jgi:hypothetical protein